MFDTAMTPPPIEGILGSVDESRIELALHAHDENVSAARKVHAARNLWDAVIGSVPESVDAVTAMNAGVAEVAVSLGCSHTAAQTLVDVGNDLVYRLPAVDEAFRRGDLDYTKVRTISVTTRDASPKTMRAIEPVIVSAATHLTATGLTREIWRLWFAVNPDEAAEVRAGKRKTDRTAYIRRGDNGLSWLSACITDIEGAEADKLISEIADTVCPDDPRSRQALRADGLMALLHGETMLRCTCGRDDCPTAGVEIAPRRGHLAQILIDIETLLGLTSTPPRLADGTLLDPELARMIAKDATWQAILTEMRTMAGQQVPDHAEEPPAEDAVDDEWAPPPPPAPLTHRHLLGRGRTHRRPGILGQLCHRRPVTATPAPGLGSVLDDLYDHLADQPPPPTPDGHGGFDTPPPGALTYRPGAVLAALVRAAHPTCTFPGCTVASHLCELDHIVSFDHNHPEKGGWTITSNLQPLCKRHHQLKTSRLWTCTRLDSGAMHWTSPTGISRITIPTGMAAITTTQDKPDTQPAPSYTDPLTEQESEALLYEPTWWETHMGTTPPPTLAEIATIKDSDQRLQALEHRDHYREHAAIVKRRFDLAPAPF